MTNIKYPKEVEIFLKDSATLLPIPEKNETWMYLPFWFKKCPDGLYEVVTFDRLPDYVKEEVQAIRGESVKEDNLMNEAKIALEFANIDLQLLIDMATGQLMPFVIDELKKHLESNKKLISKLST